MENLKSISIFFSYFVAIFTCGYIIINSILAPFRGIARRANGRTASSRDKTTNTFLYSIALFAALATISLGLTWYHILRFFHLSYKSWSTTLATPSTPRTIGYWLRETRLFEEAYRIVVITPERWWWSQQIFLACFGWGIWVGYQGHGGVPGKGGKGRSLTVLAAYMVLAQLVSLSVAVNLYFVDMLAHRGFECSPAASEAISTEVGVHAVVSAGETAQKQTRVVPAPHSALAAAQPAASVPTITESRTARTLFGFYLIACFLPTSVLPTLTHTPQNSLLNRLFFPTLLLPHVALFIPVLFAYPVSPRFTRILYMCSTFSSVVCHAASTSAVVDRVREFLAAKKADSMHDGFGLGLGYQAIVQTTIQWLGKTLLNTHPAVSSVSWDVFCFCLSVAIWAGVEGGASGGVWLGDQATEVDRVRGMHLGLGRRVARVSLAGVMMVIGGAGVGALVFAGDL